MQEFPADQPGKYINKLDLGLLKANLLAEYKYEANNKINVKFVDITFLLGPFKINRVRDPLCQLTNLIVQALFSSIEGQARAEHKLSCMSEDSQAHGSPWAALQDALTNPGGHVEVGEGGGGVGVAPYS